LCQVYYGCARACAPPPPLHALQGPAGITIKRQRHWQCPGVRPPPVPRGLMEQALWRLHPCEPCRSSGAHGNHTDCMGKHQLLGKALTIWLWRAWLCCARKRLRGGTSAGGA
jgi:hypothetical protein